MLMVSRLKFPIEPLVVQMLDQLPKRVWSSAKTTFLDPAMGGGQFLVEIQRRLLAAGHTPENIAGRVYGCEKNILRVNYAKNNKKLVTNNLYESDFLSHDWGNMKFDVIVGNPPYQSADSKRIKLWFKFVEKSMTLVSPKGYLGFVTPNSWLSQDTTVAKQTRDLFKNCCLKWLNADVSSYFNIGESVCGFVISIAEEPRYQGQKIFATEQQSVEDAVCIKMKNTSVDPAKTLLKRLYSSPHPSLNAQFKATQNKKFCNPVVHSSTETWYTCDNVDHLRGHNIIINNSGYYYHKDHPSRYIFYSDTHVAGGNAFQLTYATKQLAQNALSFLTSKLYRFFVDKTKSGGFNATALYQLPLLDPRTSWTDEKVFEFFKLDAAQIEMVEKHCE